MTIHKTRLSRALLGAFLSSLFLFILMVPLKGHSYDVEVVASFDPLASETPESVAIDRHGNRYVSLIFTGEIRKIDPEGNQSTHAFLPTGDPLLFCGIGALAIDYHSNLYVTVNACDPVDRGVWKVAPNGETTLLANLPLDALANGIALRFGQLYVADSLVGRIWRIPKWGGEAEVWVEHPLLDLVPNELGAPGANGLQFYFGELYVSNSSSGDIVAFPIDWWGEAGDPRVHAQVETGCDDFAFDLFGSLYCTTNPFNTVIKIDQDGSLETILTAEDGLDGPTAAAFGRRSDRFSLYISNAAFPFFTTTFNPTLLRVELDVPGYPFR